MRPSKRRYRKKIDRLRGEANASHRTFQSVLETEKQGWMKQWIVNTVLGRYGE